MPTRREALALLAGATGAGSAWAQPAGMAPGTQTISIEDGRGATGGPVRSFVHRPGRWTPDGRIVVVMHGVKRDADRYLANWVPLAEAHGFLLVVPVFDARKFPGAAFYNFGGMRDEGGQPLPRSAWSFGVIDTIVEAVQRLAGARRETFSLYGHSAGAQFVHRFAMFHPSPRLEMAVAANAGWYTLPVTAERFPYGLRGTGLSAAEEVAMLQRPLILQLGDRDTDPHHPSLRRTPGAERQGPHRLARGHTMIEAARERAAALGVPLAWRLHVTPGVGHSDAGMSREAARLLFG